MLKGQKASEITRKRMSEARQGIIISEETKEKMRQAKLGTKASDETKAKMTASQKLRHEKRRQLENSYK